MPFPSDFYQYLTDHTLVGVKGGTDRKTFLDIWMVTVGERVFARSWNRSARSWFTAMRETGRGQIRYGRQVLDVKGHPLPPGSPLTRQIEAAYRRKYNQPENRYYAEGITQPEYERYTMEFFFIPPES